MGVAIFENGAPARITISDFKHSMLAAFPKFTDAANDPIIDDAISAVYDIFTGVNTLWSNADKQEWYDKAKRTYLLLTAWYIADLYPKYAVGIHSTGGMPMLEKKIGDVTIKYADTARLGSVDAVLEALKSNPYGAKAYFNIKGAPNRFLLRVTPTIMQ